MKADVFLTDSLSRFVGSWAGKTSIKTGTLASYLLPHRVWAYGVRRAYVGLRCAIMGSMIWPTTDLISYRPHIGDLFNGGF
jgi:hypothetical protein